MHISLDSALGRQRRLNSVGESVFQIAPDASAGYSLRSLTGGDPSVVRVRRDSDNGERDFRSSEINSGEMVSWVNQQAIKPLDIRELEADGRTGDFLIPKAAYSLRSLGERQATVEATGDTEGRFFSFTGATGDTAALNGIQYVYAFTYNGVSAYNSAPPSPENTQMIRVSGGEWRLLDATPNPSKNYAESTSGFTEYPWEADWTGTDLENATFSEQLLGKFVIQARRNVDQALKSFTAAEVADGTLTEFANESFTSRLPLDVSGGASAAYGLRNLSSSYTGSVVEVRRSSDDAVRSFTASEVTDGTLTAWVTEYVANLVGNARYFNGTSTSVEVDRPATDSFAISGSFLSVNTGGYGILSFGDNINNRFYLGAASSGRIQIFNINAGSLVFDQTVLTDYADGTIHNFSFVTGVSGTILTIDGSEIINISTQINTSNYATSKMRFGSRFTTAYASYIEGTLYDITIDSTNAYTGLGTSVTAWEDTIGSNNGIEVNGATYTGQGFDGMVSKWHDQSGNGNDAVQATAASQPKIVDGGTYLGDVHFDGSNDYLSSSDIGAYQSSDGVGFFCAYSKDVASTSDTFGSENPQYLLQLRKSNVADTTFTARILGGKLDVARANEAGSSFFRTTSNTHTIGTDLVLSSVTGTQAVALFEDGLELSLQTDESGLTYDSATTELIIGSQDTGTRFLDGGIKEIIIYNSDQSGKRRAIEESIATANGITLLSFSRDAFVSKWYDQSVTNQAGGTATGNHAVQTTAASQPKIVDAGSLVTGGLDFDGSSSAMDIDGLALASLNYGAFALVSIDNPTASSLKTIFDSSDGVDAGFALSYGNTANKLTPFWFDGDDTLANVFSGGSNLTSAKSIYSVIIKSGASTTHIDGSSNDILTNTWNTAGTNSFSKSTIGYDQSNSGRNLNGKLAELIIYDSDQTDNRTALEANIGEAYSIAGIPAYANTVNGFVETWYDQSGNGNDSTQLTAGSQPKIVNNGNLVAGGLDFDGSDDKLNMPTDLIASINSASAFLVAKSDTTSGTRIPLALSRNSPDFRFYVGALLSNKFYFGYQDSFSKIELGSADTNKHLFTSIAGSSNAEGFLDGTSKGTVSSADGKSALSSGGIGAVNITNFWDGTIQEVIIYNSDQSANRPAIETNINSHYDIF